MSEQIKHLENIIQNNFNFIEDFVNKKLSDICFHICLFFYYLSYPRNNIGFKKINLSNELIDIETTKKFSNPLINSKMVNYIFTEIYNCKNFTSIYSQDNIEKILLNTIYKVNKYPVKSRLIYKIKKLSDNIFNENNLIIFDDVEDIVIKYLVNCIRNIIYLESSYDSLDKKFNELQLYVASVKRTYSINYLDNQITNLSFNAFLHIIICLTDWTELDEISDIEIDTALSFILTKELRQVYPEWNEDYSDTIKNFKSNKNFNDYKNMSLSQIFYILKKYDLKIDIPTAEKLIKHIFIITYNINKGFKDEEKGFLEIFTDVFTELFSL